MKAIKLLLFFSLLSSYAQPAFAISGNDWLKFSTASQNAYVIGVTDAWTNAVTMCSEANQAKQLAKQQLKLKTPPQEDCGFVTRIYQPRLSCISGRTSSQVTTIVQKFMNDYPDSRGLDMATVVWTAITVTCP